MSLPEVLSHLAIDEAVVKKTLSSPPFINVEGIINFRDFGALPSTLPSVTPLSIRAGYLFRSGELKRLTDAGKETLRQLGIKKVFDLRLDFEIKEFNAATPEVDGVHFVRLPVAAVQDYKPEDFFEELAMFEADELNAFLKTYIGALENGASSYEQILIHLRDNPSEPCLVHCTAGKDRTGVFAALVQLLLGARDEDIIEDYYLTTIGLQPALPYLSQRFADDPQYKTHWKALVNMGSAKKETMQSTLALLREKFGGAESYVKQHTSLTDADIEQIRKNLLVPAA